MTNLIEKLFILLLLFMLLVGLTYWSPLAASVGFLILEVLAVVACLLVVLFFVTVVMAYKLYRYSQRRGNVITHIKKMATKSKSSKKGEAAGWPF